MMQLRLPSLIYFQTMDRGEKLTDLADKTVDLHNQVDPKTLNQVAAHIGFCIVLYNQSFAPFSGSGFQKTRDKSPKENVVQEYEN